jgi:hypothetical protein
MTYLQNKHQIYLYRGVMRARCFPFDMEGHRFHGKNIKVFQYTYYI